MDIPINIDGFKSRAVALRPRGMFSFSPKIIIDGQPVRRTGLGYKVRNDSGQEVEFRIKYRYWDPVPDLIVAGQQIELLPALKSYEHLWVLLPFFVTMFIFRGGLFPGFCGAVCIALNYAVFRKVRHPVLRYLLTGLITVSAPLACYAILFSLGFRFPVR